MGRQAERPMAEVAQMRDKIVMEALAKYVPGSDYIDIGPLYGTVRQNPERRGAIQSQVALGGGHRSVVERVLVSLARAS